MKRSGMPLHINSHRFTSIHISSHHTTSDYADKWEKAEEDEVIDVLEPTRKVKIPEFTEISLIRHKVNTTGSIFTLLRWIHHPSPATGITGLIN